MPIELNTEDKLEYNFYPITSREINFKVRSANDAHIALTSSPVESDPMVEIFIGGWSNTKSVIRKNRTKPERTENETPNVLNAGEYRGFWVRWADNVYTVGNEGEAAAFLSWEDNEPFPINYFGICTGWGASGSWIIEGGPEIQTTDCLKYNFQALDSGSVTVDFKGPSNCHIALLSSKSEEKPLCELIIGGWNNTASAIRCNQCKPDKVHVETPNICNPSAFIKLYISWSKGHLAVRKNGPNGAIIIDGKDCINFLVTHIGVRTAWGATGQWKIDTNNSTVITKKILPGRCRDPPSAPAALTSRMSGEGPGVWVPYDGAMPNGAISGGTDGEALYIARGKYEGALIPGKYVPSHNTCYVAWGGAEHPVSEFEVLCGGAGQWIPVNGSEIPPHAMPGGETEDGEPLFIGRVHHEGSVTIGKVQGSHGCCYIPYGGQELSFDAYEVFVQN